MNHYKCCQGYYDIACFKAGSCGEDSCPDICNMLEAFFCFGCSISASRALVMDTRHIRPDPCDNRLIALNNALVMLSCVCDILAMFVEELAAVADVIDLITDIVTTIVSSCMLAQTHLEVTSDKARLIHWEYPTYPRGTSKQARQGWGEGGGFGGGGVPQQQYMGSQPPPPAYPSQSYPAPAYGQQQAYPPPAYGQQQAYPPPTYGQQQAYPPPAYPAQAYAPTQQQYGRPTAPRFP